MDTTQNRFIKVDGSFERSDANKYGSPVTGYFPTYAEAVAAADKINNSRTLTGLTSNTPNSPLPSEPTPPTTGTTTTGTTTGTTGTSATASPVDNFNLLLTGLLKNAQGVSTADYLARKRALDRTVVGDTSAMTPEELRTLSPDQQASIRSGNVKALQPDIDQNAYEIEKAKQSLDNFFNVYTEAQKLGQDFADKMVAPDSVIENARKIIESNPDLINETLAGFNDKSKQAIIGGLDYSKMGKSSSSSKIVNVNGVDYQQNADGTFTTPDVPQSSGAPSQLKTNALTTAKGLLTKFDAGNGTSAVGKSGFLNSFGYGLIPGTANANFKVDFDNLKSLLSLDNVNLLKGQGAISENERALLSSAATKLNLAQSESEFRSTLQGIVDTLNAAGAGGASGAETKTVNGVQYKKVDGGWQKVSFNTVGNTSGSNRPQQNNNPLNVKLSTFTQSFPGVAGIDPHPALDGGKFLVFDSPQSGFNAAETLLRSGVYKGLSVDAALKKWSGKGYGVEIAPQFSGRSIDSLSSSEIQSLLQTMAHREGYYA